MNQPTTLPANFNLGGTGLVGRLSIVARADKTAQIFVRNTFGQIMTSNVNYTTKGLIQSPWASVAGSVEIAGAPSAVSLLDGSVIVTGRGTDNQLYSAKSDSDSTTFSSWERVSGFQLTGDPTAFAYKNSTGSTWAIASYTQDYQIYVFTPPSASAPNRRQADADFTAHLIKP